MKRSPAAALWLSLLPGAGHVYIGQASKGFVLIVLVACAIQIVDHGADSFGVMIAFLWLYAMIDAYRSAQEHNLLVETGRPLPKPAAFAFTRWWGWALVGVGTVFLVDNFELLDIEWLWNFWPLGLVGLGVFILKQPAVPESGITSEAPPPIPATSDPATSDPETSDEVASEWDADASDMPTERAEPPAEPPEPGENAESSDTESEPERD